MFRTLIIRLLASIAIAALFLWLSINHMVADATEAVEGSLWDAMVSATRRVSVGSLATYGVIFLGVHLARIHRWHYLITPLGERDLKKIFRICAVGFSAIVVLPLRLGEMVRPIMLAKESEHVSMSSALGTAVVERVIDGLVITGLLFVSIATYSGDAATGFATATGVAAALVFSGASLVLGLTAWRHDWTVNLLNATVGRVSHRLCDVVVGLVEGFLRGVRVLRNEGVLLRFMVLTVVYWGLNGLGMAYLAQAFGLELGVWQAFGVLAILVVGIMIPAGPGFFGNYQFFLGKGLLLFVSAEQGVILAFGLVLNTIQFVLQVLFGVPFYLASHMGIRRLLEAGGGPEALSASEEPAQRTS